MTGPIKLAAAVAAVAALAAAPAVLDRGLLFLLVEICVILTMAQMWNLLAGFAGLVSLGHHAFVGVGAYALFAITRDLPISPYPAVLFSGLAAAFVALLLAPVLVRLRAAYFSIAMWVAAEIIRILVTRWEYLGATSGLPLYAARGLDRAWMASITYWLALALAVGSVAVVYGLIRAPQGLGLLATRDNLVAARSLGVAVNRNRLIAFILSAAGCGMAGAVMFLSTLFVAPEAAFDLNWVVIMIFVAVIGGVGTLEGPIIGVIVYFALRETLAFAGGWHLITVGCVAIATMIFAPHGAAGYMRKRFGIELFDLRRHAPNAMRPEPVMAAKRLAAARRSDEVSRRT